MIHKIRIITFVIIASFLPLAAKGLLSAPELIPVEVKEEMEGETTTTETEFWQIQIDQGIATLHVVSSKRMGEQRYADVWTMTSSEVTLLTSTDQKQVFRLTFPTSTGQRQVAVTVSKVGKSFNEISQIDGYSISTSIFSNKVIKKTFSISKKKSHVIAIDR